MHVTYGCGIEQMAVCVPAKKITIEDRRFSKIVGIKEKRADANLYSTDLGLAAARQLDLTGVKFIVFASQTHDTIIPFSSNRLQHELGLKAGTIDLVTGCTGFIVGLLTSFNLCMSSRDKVLFVIADTLNRTTGQHDKSSELIFGDGAAACVIGHNSHSHSNGWFSLYSDGGKADAIRMTGGIKDPGVNNIFMDGDAVLNFAIDEVPKAVAEMESICMPMTYVFHQSNKMILDHFEKLIPDYAFMPRSIETFGNTSGASIPITLTLNEIKDTCMFIGYGSGLTWGTAIIDMSYCEYKGIVEI